MMAEHTFQFDNSQQIGTVTNVEPARVHINLTPPAEPQVNGSGGSSPFHAAVGAYVVVGLERYILIGQINEITLGDQYQDANAVVDIFSSIAVDEKKIISGILHPPQIGSPVYSPSKELIEFVVSGDLQSPTPDGSAPLKLHLAELRNITTSAVNVSPERLFGRHCAILGATGGGKSWSLARIVEEVSKFQAKLILIDATGEYEDLDTSVTHVHFGDDSSARDDSVRISVPYHHLSEQDLFAMFKPTGASQGPKLRAAMKSLKLAQVSSSVGVDGQILKAHKSKRQYERSLKGHKKEIEAPYANFNIKLLPQQIENECVEQQRSSTEPDVWGGTNSIDLGNCMPMISRIHDMLQSPYLSAVFQPKNYPSIFEKLHSFIRSDSSRIFRINMRNLSFAFDTRKIIANALGRHIFELGQLGCFQKRPLLVVMDEAHQFLTDQMSPEEGVSLDTFGLIAKEGRKYAVTLCIATQRPRDIPEDILSQMGTLLVHRLINDNDRNIIERASGDVDESTLRLIPSLAPGEAILTGVDFPLPLHVKIQAPLCTPASSGADYQNYWRAR